MMYLVYLSVLLFAILSAYIVGHFLFSIVRRDTVFSNLAWLFFKLLTGFVVCTLVFACIKTHFATVYISLFPLGLLGIYYLKQVDALVCNKKTFYDNLANIEYKELLALAGILVLVFFLQYNQLFDFSGAALSVDLDTAFYAQVGAYINQSGIESLVLDPTFADNPPVFYHYFEIWFGVLFADIFSLNILNSLVLVSNAFMLGLMLIGAAVILQQHFAISLYKALLLTLSLLFMWKFSIVWNNETLFTTKTNTLSVLRVQKLCPVYISLVLFFILFPKRNLLAQVFPFCLMFVLYGPTLPAAFSGGCLYCFCLVVTKQQKFNRELTFSLLSLLLPVIGIILFYACMGSLQNGGEGLIEAGSRITELLGMVSVFIKKTFFYMISIVPFLLVIYFLNKKRAILPNWRSFLLLFFVIFCGQCISVFYEKAGDAHQLFTNIYIPFMTFVGFCIVMLLLNSGMLWQRILAVLLIVFQFYTNFSFHNSPPIDQSYYEKIANVMANKKANCAYLFDAETVCANDVIRSANVVYVNKNLPCYTNAYLPVFLNSFDLLDCSHLKPTSVEYIKSSVLQNPFYRYVIQQRENGLNKTISEFQYAFIRANNIRFLITDKNSQCLQYAPFSIKQIIESDTEPFWFVEIQPS